MQVYLYLEPKSKLFCVYKEIQIMIKNFLLSNGAVSETDPAGANILHYIKPTEAEKLELIAKYQLDPHDLESALTPHALPRIEF